MSDRELSSAVSRVLPLSMRLRDGLHKSLDGLVGEVVIVMLLMRGLSFFKIIIVGMNERALCCISTLA